MVALTGLLKSDFYTDGTYIIDIPTKLVDRGQLSQAGGFIPLPSLAGAGTDSGEPNAAAYTDTIWYELPVDVDTAETVRLLLDPNGSTAKVSAYWSSVGDPTESVEPTYPSLTLIQAASVDQIITVDPDWQSIYLQVGLNSGAGTDMTLTWGDADPEEGGTFDSAYEIFDDNGFEDGDIHNAWLETGEPTPAGLTPLRSIWFAWECPTPPPDEITFTATTSVATDFGIAIYSGTAVNALTTIASSTGVGPGAAEVTFNPATGGEIYYIQITSESMEGIYNLSWEIGAEIVEPAEIFDYISVRAYSRNGVTFITELKNRKDVRFQENLNVPGSGQVSVPMGDEILKITPYPLSDGNIIKFFFGSKCVSGFRIQKTEMKMVSSGEHAERMITVSGPTVHQLLDDFVVTHEDNAADRLNVGLGNPRAKDERTFSWASGVFPGFRRADWNNRTNANKRSNPPGGKPGLPPKKRPKWGMPKKWPVPNAMWMWLSQNRNQNERRYQPPRLIKGQHYYRKAFYIKAASERIRMWSSSDDYHEIWLDGEKVIESNETESGYKTFKTFTTPLQRGRHTIAVYVLDKNNAGDRNDSFIFALASLRPSGKIKSVLMTSNRNWFIWQGPNPPAWRRAEILRQVWLEARSLRFNDSALALGCFSFTHDSYGRPWKKDRINMSVKVGTSALDLQSQLSESAQFDVWVDAGTMQIKAAPRRGKDRSQNIAFDFGYNLGEYTIEATNRVKNRLLIHFLGGLVWYAFPASVNKYGEREGFVELGGIRGHVNAINTVKAAGRYVSESDQRAGAPDVVQRPVNEPHNTLIGVEGAYPFLDFEVGDIISAPSETGALKKHRVISLACVESDDGIVTFDPDLEPWLQ